MIICSYCDAANAAGPLCVACGAPLPEANPEPIQAPGRQPAPVQISQERQALQDTREMGEKIDKVSHSALYLYSTFWRTLAEAIVIALVSFGLGAAGGATGQALGGVLTALVVGALVGWAVKISYLTYLSAPTGFAVGAGLCVVVYLLGVPPGVMVYVLAAFSGAAALVGGRRISWRRRNGWEKARPFLGALGGLGFGLLGMGIGLGLRAALAAI